MIANIGLTKRLAAFCHNTSYIDFAEEVVDRAKYHLLDFIGVTVRGSIVPLSQVMFDFVQDFGVFPAGSVVIGTQSRVSLQYAALANGTFSHAIEMDDVNNDASLHPAAVILPAALAVGEHKKSDGKRFIEAIVLGYEVTVRLGKALGPSLHYARGFHPTSTCGAFGAAVTAGKILGLDEGRMVNALGIVGSMFAGSMEIISEDAWTKKLNPGWAAHSGVMAALLARKGFKAPSTMLEGRHGFLFMGSDHPEPEKVLENIGASFEIVRTSIKPYACCRYIQGPIDAVLDIKRRHGIQAEDVKSVTLSILKAGIPFVVEPRERKYRPNSLVEAQFSTPFGVAMALRHGKAGPEEYVPENWLSPETIRLMDRVVCIGNEEIEADYPRKWPAIAEIQTYDGRSFSSRVEYPKGDPENPLSWDELESKFDDLSKVVFSPDRRARIIETVYRLETENNLSDLYGLLQVENVG